ncbi:MAG: WGR domain-containing protein [Flavobacteriales bacterium]
MKTIREARLYFKDDKSDKVYQVDLCSVEDNLYTVLFRYGKRGSTLREGTKTIFPVAEEEALKIFNDLVLSKTKKGYKYQGAEAETPAPDYTTQKNGEQSIAEKTIINYLSSNSYDRDWPVSRVLWRAGELKIQDAAPHILKHVNSTHFIEQYSAIWALGRCSTKLALDELYKVWDSTTDLRIKRIAAKVLLSVDEAAGKRIVKAINESLPFNLTEQLASLDEEKIYQSISEYIKFPNVQTSETLVSLYLLVEFNMGLERALLRAIENLDTRLNTFKALRQLYKLAEFDCRYDYLAMCAKVMGLKSSNYSSSGYGVWIEGKYVNISENKASHNTVLSFSSKTKNYFAKRTLRNLKKAGSDAPLDYIKLATEILLSVSDEKDGERAFKLSFYDYTDGWKLVDRWFPKYHHFTAYNQIIFGASERVDTLNHSAFSFVIGQQPLSETVALREDYLPHLWNDSPQEIFKLLGAAQVVEVNDFALKVFQANSKFEALLTESDLVSILKSSYDVTSAYFVKVIRSKYLLSQPSFELIVGLLDSEFTDSIDLGTNYLKKHIASQEVNASQFSRLISLGRTPVIEFITDNSRDFSNVEPLVFSQLLDLISSDEKYGEEFFTSLIRLIKTDQLRRIFAQLKSSDLEHFIASDRSIIVELGITLILVNEMPTHELAAEHIESILNSSHQNIRAAGMELLLEFPESYLEEKETLLVSFIFSEYSEVREKVKPLITRLVQENEDLRKDIFIQLISAISEIETVEGIHQSHIELLNESFKTLLKSISIAAEKDLLLSSVDASQKLGEQLYHELNFYEKFQLADWVELKNSDVYEVRKDIIKFYKANSILVLENMETALLSIESKWADLRDELLAWFLENTSAENWTLELILQVIDSPNEDSQAFGRSVITRVFSAEKGKQLMIHLSEHPSRSMMLFNSNYLNLHAKGNEDVVLQLKHYFKAILYAVNEGAASKKRVFAFLRQEILGSKKVAEMTLEIINDLLKIQAKGDKSRTIDLALEINEYYSDLELPVVLTPLKAFSHAV